MSLISTISHLSTPMKIGIGAVALGATVATAAVLSGCASPKDPADFTKGLFANFDTNPNDGGISRDESSRQRVGQVQTQDVYQYKIGNVEVYDRQTIQRSWTDSVLKAVNVADTNGDAIAGWDELKALANKFDTNGDGILKGGEQSAFTREYGPEETNSQWHILGHQTVFSSPDTTYPRSGGNGSGNNSPGDSYGNSPGDSYGRGGSNPGGSGNSPGDSGSIPLPVPNRPAPNPGNSGGDSYKPGTGSGSTPPSHAPVPSGNHPNPTDKDF